MSNLNGPGPTIDLHLDGIGWTVGMTAVDLLSLKHTFNLWPNSWFNGPTLSLVSAASNRFECRQHVGSVALGLSPVLY